MTGLDAVLADLSLEVSAADAPTLSASAHRLPPGSRVHVTALGTETTADRIAVSSQIVGLGLTPVAHLAARRLADASELDAVVAGLAHASAQQSVFVVGGDPRRPVGPFASAIDVIGSGALERHGVQAVGIGGYPEGHPDIATDVLWDALGDKAAALTDRGLAGSITTQVSFDAAAVLAWIADARERGIHLPVRVGVPGPIGVARLLSFARRVGIGSSTTLARKYGSSMGALLGNAGPDDFLHELVAGLDPAVHGEVSAHLFTFGSLPATLEWLEAQTADA